MVLGRRRTRIEVGKGQRVPRRIREHTLAAQVQLRIDVQELARSRVPASPDPRPSARSPKGDRGLDSGRMLVPAVTSGAPPRAVSRASPGAHALLQSRSRRKSRSARAGSHLRSRTRKRGLQTEESARREPPRGASRRCARAAARSRGRRSGAAARPQPHGGRPAMPQAGTAPRAASTRASTPGGTCASMWRVIAARIASEDSGRCQPTRDVRTGAAGDDREGAAALDPVHLDVGRVRSRSAWCSRAPHAGPKRPPAGGRLVENGTLEASRSRAPRGGLPTTRRRKKPGTTTAPSNYWPATIAAGAWFGSGRHRRGGPVEVGARAGDDQVEREHP